MLKPETKQLRGVLTYRIVSGTLSTSQLMRTIQTSSGQAGLTTLQSGFLTPRIERDKVVIIDTKGGKASVLKADLATSKGVIHVTDAVSMRG